MTEDFRNRREENAHRQHKKQRVQVLGFPFERVTFAQAVQRAVEFVRSPVRSDGHHVITANPELLMKAMEPDRDGKLLRQALEDASLVVADGIGVVWASRVEGAPLPERIAGIDLAEAVLRVASDEGWRVFLVGAADGVAELAATRLVQKHSGLRVVGTHHGYFNEEDAEQVAIKVGLARPDVLLVGMGVPKQEWWITTFRRLFEAKLMIGVGGALDVFAGNVRRAPPVFQKFGLEWAYRLITQPWRAGRMAAIPRFVVHVLRRRLKEPSSKE